MHDVRGTTMSVETSLAERTSAARLRLERAINDIVKAADNGTELEWGEVLSARAALRACGVDSAAIELELK